MGGAYLKGMRNTYKVLVRKPEGKRQLDSGIYGKIILRWILNK
jgi:hypothetical protein